MPMLWLRPKLWPSEELPSRLSTRAWIPLRSPSESFRGIDQPTWILARRLTPRVLGQLVALYEHQVFTQGLLWNIYSFDQWGVELGKTIAGRILQEVTAKSPPDLDHDPSTNQLIRLVRGMRERE